jgi:hypothetical protein
MCAAAITVTTVRALLAVWLATTPAPLAPGPGQPPPDRPVAGGSVRAWPGPEWPSDGLTVAPVEADREGAIEAAETGEDERDDFARGLAGERPAFGSNLVGPSPWPGAPPCLRSADPGPLFLLCGRLTC